MDCRLSDREWWLVERATVVVGFVHLLVPGALLAAAKRGYRLGLAVEFEPTEATTRRVRLVGIGMLAAVALGHRLSCDREAKSYSGGDTSEQ